MAHLLQFKGETQYVRIEDGGVDFMNWDEWEVVARFRRDKTDDIGVYLIDNDEGQFDNYIRIGVDGTSAVPTTRIRYGSAQNTHEWMTGFPDDGEFHTFRAVRRANGEHEIWYDGVSQGVSRATTAKSSVLRNQIGRSTDKSGDFTLEYLTINDRENGVPVHDWQPSASSGVGDMLYDVVGDKHGKLYEFVPDESYWVYYRDLSTTSGQYGLKFSENSLLSFPPLSNTVWQEDFYIKIDFIYQADDPYGEVGILRRTGTLAWGGMRFDHRGQIRMASVGGNTYPILPLGELLDEGRRYVIEITRVKGLITLKLDGTERSSTNDNAQFEFTGFGSSDSDDQFKGYLFELVLSDTNQSYRYIADQSTGDEIPDTGTENSTQVATLENFPADDSKWVFFESDFVEYISYDMELDSLFGAFLPQSADLLTSRLVSGAPALSQSILQTADVLVDRYTAGEHIGMSFSIQSAVIERHEAIELVESGPGSESDQTSTANQLHFANGGVAVGPEIYFEGKTKFRVETESLYIPVELDGDNGVWFSVGTGANETYIGIRVGWDGVLRMDYRGTYFDLVERRELIALANGGSYIAGNWAFEIDIVTHRWVVTRYGRIVATGTSNANGIIKEGITIKLGARGYGLNYQDYGFFYRPGALMGDTRVYMDDVLTHHFSNRTGSGETWLDVVTGQEALLLGMADDGDLWRGYTPVSSAEHDDGVYALDLSQGRSISLLPITGLNASDTWEVRMMATAMGEDKGAGFFSLEIPGSSSYWLLLGWDNDDNQVKISSPGKTPGNGPDYLPSDEKMLHRLVWNGTELQHWYNDKLNYGVVPDPTLWPASGFTHLNIGQRATVGTAFPLEAIVSYVEVIQNGQVIHRFDPDASNGNQRVLIDTVTGTSHDLPSSSNWPLDYSFWTYAESGQQAIVDYSLQMQPTYTQFVSEQAGVHANRLLDGGDGRLAIEQSQSSTLAERALLAQAADTRINASQMDTRAQRALMVQAAQVTAGPGQAEALTDRVLNGNSAELTVSPAEARLIAQRDLQAQSLGTSLFIGDLDAAYERTARLNSSDVTLQGSSATALAQRVTALSAMTFSVTSSAISASYNDLTHYSFEMGSAQAALSMDDAKAVTDKLIRLSPFNVNTSGVTMYVNRDILLTLDTATVNANPGEAMAMASREMGLGEISATFSTGGIVHELTASPHELTGHERLPGYSVSYAHAPISMTYVRKQL